MPIETTLWDMSERLESPEAVAAMLEVLFEEEGDPSLFAAILGDIAKGLGMTLIAERYGVSRADLYRAIVTEGREKSGVVRDVLEKLGKPTLGEPDAHQARKRA